MREHGTKATPVFLPADGESSWWLLPSSVSLLLGDTVQPENTYSCILYPQGDRSGLRKSKKHKHQQLPPAFIFLSEPQLI